MRRSHPTVECLDASQRGKKGHFFLQIKMQGRGGEEKSLLYDPGSELLRLGGREKKRAKKEMG